MDIQTAFRTKHIGSLKHRILNSSRAAEPRQEQEPLYRFDSGLSISMQEAWHNVLILGGTGRGKTSTYVTPMLGDLMARGLGGLIIDIKNNFSTSVRKLAGLYGREADIIEIGSHDSATPVNILAGMEQNVMLESVESLIMAGFQDTKNKDWLAKGVALVQDCAQILCYLDRSHPGEGLTPSLALLSRVIDDPLLANQLWQYFTEHMDSSDPDQARLKSRVESNAFHILHSPRSGASSRYMSEWDMQVTWRLSVPRKILNDLTAGGLDRTLSATISVPLDLHDLILRKNEIILLRFSANTGGPGKALGRLLKERFYRLVYNRFDLEPESKKPVFAIMDEFQDILNLDESSSLDDFSWSSKAREFNVINVVATQSMSSLYRIGMEHRVRAMLSNFGAKIILQTDDPATDKWARHFYSANCPVQDLGPAQALVAKYALPERKLLVSVEEAQKVHDRTKACLDQTSFPAPKNSTREEVPIEQVIQKFQRPKWAMQDRELAQVYEQFPTVFSPVTKMHLSTFNWDLRSGWVNILEKLAKSAHESDLIIREFSIDETQCLLSAIGDMGKANSLTERAKKLHSRCCFSCGSINDSPEEAFACCFTDKHEVFEKKQELIQDYGYIFLKGATAKLHFPGWDMLIRDTLDDLIGACPEIQIYEIENFNGLLKIWTKRITTDQEAKDRVQDILKNGSEKSKTVCINCGSGGISSTIFHVPTVLCHVCTDLVLKAKDNTPPET